jgi:hypothetical protein
MMAINPNTDFTTGQVLTSSQANRFPRGIMAFTSVTASDTTVTAEEVQVTGASFTAVANRYYRITYYEPQMLSSSAGIATLNIRQTNISGTILNSATCAISTTQQTSSEAIAVTTLSAGATNVVATLTMSAGTGSATRSSTRYAFLLVEDIGPA